MGGFATNGVNMTKLESYMVGGSFTATQFYAEVEGRMDDPAMQHAFAELNYFAHSIVVLGTFPGDPARRAGGRGSFSYAVHFLTSVPPRIMP